MSTDPSNQRPNQSATGGRDVNQVGGNFSNTTNFNFVFFLVGILALGGLAWGLYVGKIDAPNFTQQQAAPQSSPAPVTP